MNLNAEPPQPPQPHRLSTSCDLHPDEHFTGFCPLCLYERLALLDTTNSTTTTSRKPPISTTATAALKAIFKPSSSNSSASRASFFPELRRTKSFSASKNDALSFSGVLFEPQRKSCDVRARNHTLWSLFSQEDDRKKEIVGGNVDSVLLRVPVKEEDIEVEIETEIESDYVKEEISRDFDSNPLNPIEARVSEIVEEEEEEEIEEVFHPNPNREPEIEIVDEEDIKPMKYHIDLDAQPKKPTGRDFKEIAGSFWSAASVFSKKWQKWRQKQKMKKQRNNGGACSARLPLEKPIGRQYRETQSEIADYGFGRRSCDTDPRFSLDAGRISFDDPRYSLDEPRASWDGYLVGRNFTTNATKMPTMLSVVEDDTPVVHVSRTDTQIPVEYHSGSLHEDENVNIPGGSSQTKEYYSDSSARRRKSFERSNSIRKTAAAVVENLDESKIEYLNGRDSNSNSFKEDFSETFELKLRDNGPVSVIGTGISNGNENMNSKGSKKSRKWGKPWSIWGFINRRSINKDDEDDEKYNRANGVSRSLSESWDNNREARVGFNPRMLRSNSSVSWRHSNPIGGGPLRKNGFEDAKKKDEFVLERNRSGRFSPPRKIDNGMLRFYLAPMRGGSGRRGGIMKTRANHAHSIARSVLQLY